MKCKNLGADLEQRDASIATLSKEKKNLEAVNAQTMEELAAAEDKGNHLNKLKAKLESQLEEVTTSSIFVERT